MNHEKLYADYVITFDEGIVIKLLFCEVDVFRCTKSYTSYQVNL